MRTSGLAKRCVKIFWALSAIALAHACELDPLRTQDLCKGPGPISRNCAQCRRQPPLAPECPQCLETPDDCPPPVGMSTPAVTSDSGAQSSAGNNGGAGGVATMMSGVAGEAAAGGHVAPPGSESGAGGAGQPNLPSAGSAADGGSSGARSTCQRDEDCPAATPGCVVTTGVCVVCTKRAHCPYPQACDTERGLCVECATPEDCQGGVCDLSQHRCFPCMFDVDCKDPINGTCSRARECVDCQSDDVGCTTPEAPVCLGTSCVQCRIDGDCRAPNPKCSPEHTCAPCLNRQGDCSDPSTPLCQVETRRCVQCLEDRDCPDADAAQCRADNTCAGCDTDAQCSHLTDTPLCDSETHHCVQCLERKGCGDNACILTTHTCSTVRANSQPACAACQADGECVSGTLCVAMTFGASAKPVGNYCLVQRGAIASGSCTMRPYSRTLTSQTSVDGVVASVCGPPSTTTCKGVSDAADATIHCTSSSQCGMGMGMGDALCNDNIQRCSYVCQTATDCPSSLNCTDGKICGL